MQFPFERNNRLLSPSCRQWIPDQWLHKKPFIPVTRWLFLSITLNLSLLILNPCSNRKTIFLIHFVQFFFDFNNFSTFSALRKIISTSSIYPLSWISRTWYHTYQSFLHSLSWAVTSFYNIETRIALNNLIMSNQSFAASQTPHIYNLCLYL